MKDALEKLKGNTAIATIAAGPFGRHIRFGPSDDGDGDGDGSGDQGGDQGDGAGDDGNDGGSGEGDKGDLDGDKGDQSALKDKGLFKKDGEGDGDQGEGDKGEGDKGDEETGRPEGVPEQFWNEEKKEVDTEALLKSHKDTKTAYDKLKRDKGIAEAPEKSEEYFAEPLKFEDDDLSNLPAPEVDDPLMNDFAQECHELGLSVDQARALAKGMYKRMDARAPEAIDRESEIKSLGENGENVVDGVFTWLEGMEKSGDLSERDVEIAGQLSQTADGIRFMNKFRTMTGQQPLPVASLGGEQMSAQDWYSEYDKAIDAGDYAKQEALDAKANKMWPEGMPMRHAPEARPLESKSQS